MTTCRCTFEVCWGDVEGQSCPACAPENRWCSFVETIEQTLARGTSYRELDHCTDDELEDLRLELDAAQRRVQTVRARRMAPRLAGIPGLTAPLSHDPRLTP
jgi:hypothetical protein